MKKVLFAVLVLPLFAGCKTPASSLKDADSLGGAGGTLHCTYDSPVGYPELFDLTASPGNGALQNVTLQYTSAKGVKSPAQTIGTAAAVGLDAMTQNGTKELRAYLKDLVNVDVKKFDCYGVENGQHVSYLCLSKKTDEGGRPSLFITNNTAQRFVSALTVYRAECKGG